MSGLGSSVRKISKGLTVKRMGRTVITVSDAGKVGSSSAVMQDILEYPDPRSRLTKGQQVSQWKKRGEDSRPHSPLSLCRGGTRKTLIAQLQPRRPKQRPINPGALLWLLC